MNTLMTAHAGAPMLPDLEGDAWWFIDIAAQRIQTWLARSDRLRMRRGASYRLAALTSRDAICDLLRQHANEVPPDVVWNDAAGEISGVVPLMFPAQGRTEVQAHADGQTVARLVATHLRAVLPTCPLVGMWGAGPSYVEAFPDMRRRMEVGDVVLDFAGETDEVVLARACQGCRQSRAAWRAVPIVKEHTRDLCPDCGARFAGAGYSSMPIDELPQSQRTLVRGLNALLRDQQGEGPRPDGDSAPLGDDFPKDFEDLAKRGAVRTGDAPTQLALVFADGNRIGKMIQEWLDRGGTAADDASVPVPKSAIVVALDHATKSAIVAATRLTFRPWLDVPEAPPVLVHLAGGDDVLVSVPAAYGWTFARNLSAAFTEACGRPQPASVNPQATPGPDGLVTNPLQLAFGEGQLPSISIGLVFHHNSHPIADVIDKAESQLHHAKRAFSGREAAIAFHDLTSDGEAAPAQEWSRPDPPGRPAVKAMTLSAAASTIDALTRTSRAHRATLLQLLRECRDGDPAQGDLGRRVEQISDPAIIEAVRSCPGTSKDAIVRGLLEHKDPQHRNHLRLLLDIARHWQAEGDRDDCP